MIWFGLVWLTKIYFLPSFPVDLGCDGQVENDHDWGHANSNHVHFSVP
jgi:hypothetical protein